MFAINDNVSYIADNSDCPPAFIVTNPERTRALVCMMGMTSLQSRGSIIDGWLNGGTESPNAPKPYNQGATLIQQGIGLPSGFQWDQLVFIGHSLGGANVTVAAPLVVGNFPSPPIGTQNYLYTFGAPQCIIRRERQEMYDQYAMRRCFLPADPVPNLPPNGGRIGDFAPYATAYIRRLTSWTQPGMGLQFNGAEFPQPAQAPFNDQVVQFAGSVLDWLTGINAFGNAEHSLASYTSVVNSIANGSGGFDDNSLPVLHQRPQTATPTQINQALDTMIGVQQSIVRLDPNGVAAGIQRAFPLVPGIKFRGVKSHGHRAVVYGPQLVTFVHSRRLQISLVRFLNRELRKGQSFPIPLT